MKIMPASPYTLNFNQKIHNINFKAGKSQLIPVEINSFKTETAKKLYLKIRKYFLLIGDNGSIKNANIMHFVVPDEKLNYFSRKISGTDTLLSINRKSDVSTMHIVQKYPNSFIPDTTIMYATFDKNAQMISGQFLSGGLSFERSKGNIRRMQRGPNRNIYMPVGGNDREWDFGGYRIPSTNSTILMDDDPFSGMFEIFIELARLKTSLLK